MGINRPFLAAGSIFIMHFIIDFSRVYFEQYLFKKDDFVIIDKKQLFRSAMNGFRGNSELDKFMQKYFWKWIGVNITDQSLHMVSLILCVWIITN